MDHNLEDTLNLESAISEMDFTHSEDAVVSQADITLEASGQEGDIPMEFEHIEQQPMLMDTGNEEIIVSDFMGEQFTLQEYSIKDDQTSGATTTEESNIQSILQSQSETMVNLQFEPPLKQENPPQTKYISVKAAVPRPPRPVAIAPKPSKFSTPVHKPDLVHGKQYAIAPKPVALVANRTGIMQGTSKGNTVLAQIGKQLVMLPTGGSQKIKLVSTSNSGVSTVQYAQIISKSVPTTQSAKPVVAKVIGQAQSSNQPAVITKILPTGSAVTPQARYVMHQKTIPISIANNKVLLTSPTKQGKKQQIITIKSNAPTKQSQAPTTTKKIVITANSSQNVILKTAAPKTTQINKESKVLVQGQRSQLHKIDVPGKGIQLIRLITNPTTTAAKPVTKPPPAIAVPSKTFVLQDSKVVTSKPQQKLVRIAAAPPVTKSSHSVQPTRSAQSLLAPLATADTSPTTMEEIKEIQLLPHTLPVVEEVIEEADVEEEVQKEEVEEEQAEDSKTSLQALIADTVGNEVNIQSMQEVEVEYERQQSPIREESVNSIDQQDSSTRPEEHPLIVIPSNYRNSEESLLVEDLVKSEEKRKMKHMLNVEEVMNPYQSPTTPPAVSESDVVSTELGIRPRKACNCTKSQCLKLYCDCFANGEFCNRCNCNNCHNNLENEELRQKAIRACLDRNPNAFRPKIGKSKTGGPEIIRRHNKGCNCKRSGCLKNYCECYEAKIACTSMCKCVGCRNVEETLERARRRDITRRHPLAGRDPRLSSPTALYRPPPLTHHKQPCSFMTSEVIEAVCQCLVAAAAEPGTRTGEAAEEAEPDPMRDVIEEFARCLQDIISASHQTAPLALGDDV
ncbi:protein lin-54 homolog isoform X2 [Galleria mellonella]|uniref:Protein lin-54 homolog isoform X2 n=1 Tax=Galleria mellonella TaxID=7137 RepID=A0ABM3MV15_GALME|nr:protein lin-54 homolog isoform X2 [Galleria mellonella]